MAQISWIKISVNIFNDEKMQMIDEYENRDMIQNVWFKLLTLAGNKNQGGKIGFSEKKPYSNKMLSVVLKRPEADIVDCLDVLEEFEMIWKDDDGFIYITNWDKHQNIEGMEKIKEQNRERQRKYRENKKENSNVTSRDSNGTEQNRTDKTRQEETRQQQEEKVVVDDVVLSAALKELEGRDDIRNKKAYALKMIADGWQPVKQETKKQFKGFPPEVVAIWEEYERNGCMTDKQRGSLALHREFIANGGVYEGDNK